MSKITDGFEDRNIVQIFLRYFREETEKPLAHARALEAKLKEREWQYDTDSGVYICSKCGGLKPTHSPNCELAKLLD